jgi:hypothetical protein
LVGSGSPLSLHHHSTTSVSAETTRRSADLRRRTRLADTGTQDAPRRVSVGLGSESFRLKDQSRLTTRECAESSKINAEEDVTCSA